jgi:4-amino-4-deoxy-L-arabinose transferase-like glycosyltransferase
MRWLLWLCVLAALIDLRAFGLTDLDEGFYSSVAWEMRQSGDWRTPTFLGEPWFEKPPLLYWLMVGSMRVFGENEFALRLPSALMYALTIVLLAWWGNRRLGQGAGSWAALLFALAPLSLILARLAITDMALVFFLTVAVIALWEARGLGWSLIGGVALGLAFLTKGPFGLGLVGLLYLWNARTLHAQGLRFRWVLLALVVALLTALPWYVGIYLQHGGAFFNEFVVKQNLLRFAGGDTAHSVLPLIQRGDVGGVLAGVAVYLLFYVVVLWLGGLSMVGWARRAVGARGRPAAALLASLGVAGVRAVHAEFHEVACVYLPDVPCVGVVGGRACGAGAACIGGRFGAARAVNAPCRDTRRAAGRGGVGERRAVSSALGRRAVGGCAHAGHAADDARAVPPSRAALDADSGRACAADWLERRADGL